MQNTEPICFRMDPRNKKILEKLADEKGLKIGTYMRFQALKIIEKNETVNIQTVKIKRMEETKLIVEALEGIKLILSCIGIILGLGTIALIFK